MPRRRRSLTEAERTLWNSVAETTTRLPSDHFEPLETAPAAPVIAETPEHPRLPRPQHKLKPAGRPVAQQTQLNLSADPMEVLDRAAPGMDRKRFQNLRKGKLKPDAKIDLHGMTAERAKSALTGFILRAHSDGLRLVLVITGKGRPGADPMAPHRTGVLRHAVPHWLQMPPLGPLILQVTPAHRSHGGTGAYYVYLRRAR
ncbi:MAG: Smr/MutS family protein [Pseudomonadota bacterium]